MVALPLFDLVLSTDDPIERSRAVAGQLLHAALLDLQQIEKLDESLMPPDSRQFDRATAALIRGLYEDWAHQAQALIERLGNLERRSTPIEGAEALRDAHGRTRAMLSVSLDDMEQGIKDIAEGRTVPLEEVRRELRLGVR